MSDTYWDEHDEGVNGRPRPGTRVEVGGDEGVVQSYEGRWNSTVFPVKLAKDGTTEMCTNRNVRRR